MITHRLTHAASVLAIALTAATVTILALMPAAVAYPPSDGPNMHSSPPALPSSTSDGSPAWVFLIVVAVTAVIAVLSTLTVVRVTGDKRAASHAGSTRGGVEVLPTP